MYAVKGSYEMLCAGSKNYKKNCHSPESLPAHDEFRIEGGKRMKTVLWISRHKMTPEQMSDLERIMDGPVALHQWQDTVTDIADLAPAIRASEAVAAVLPTELLAELLRAADGKPVLVAVSERVRLPDTQTAERTEPEFAFVHRCWQQVLRLEIEMRTL